MLVRMHGDVAGDVVKDIGLRQIIQLVGAANGDGGGELTITKAIKEEEGGNISANCLSLKAGQRPKKAIDVREVGNTVGVQAERSDTLEKLWVGVAVPARQH